jgi:hypothetical protein
MACPHSFIWNMATNEDGWQCAECAYRPGEPPGFSPAHDVEELGAKVTSILNVLHDSDIVYVSNCDEGESLVTMVTKEIRERGELDQYAIAEAILNLMGQSHTAYWKEIRDGILAGKDLRHRCHCGKLATCSQGGARACSVDHLPNGGGF